MSAPALHYVAVGCTHTHTLCTLSIAWSLSTTLHLWCLQLLTPHPQLSCLFLPVRPPPHILIPPPPLYRYFSCFLLLPSSFLSPHLPSPFPLHISRTINETVPTLIRNPNAWNNVANVLFCECTHENVIHLCHN